MNESTEPVVGERREIKRNANLKDITGRRCGNLKVVGPAPGRWDGQKWEVMWRLRCDCGNLTEVRGRCLYRTKSCGCIIGKVSTPKLLWKRFNRFSVIAGPRYSGKASEWLCRCDCGTEKWVEGNQIQSGNTKSCGCLKKEVASERFKTHGASGTKLYDTYSRIKARTTNPNNQDFHHYGGRGILMCQEWIDSFEAFAAHLGEPPSPKHSVDRIDNERGYEPGNVRWATQAEQVRNTRRVVRVKVGDEVLCLKDACEKLGLSYKAMIQRTHRGMSVEEAMAKPLRPVRPKGSKVTAR